MISPTPPKSIRWSDLETGILTIKPPPASELMAFYQSHSEHCDICAAEVDLEPEDSLAVCKEHGVVEGNTHFVRLVGV